MKADDLKTQVVFNFHVNGPMPEIEKLISFFHNSIEAASRQSGYEIENISAEIQKKKIYLK